MASRPFSTVNVDIERHNPPDLVASKPKVRMFSSQRLLIIIPESQKDRSQVQRTKKNGFDSVTYAWCAIFLYKVTIH